MSAPSGNYAISIINREMLINNKRAIGRMNEVPKLKTSGNSDYPRKIAPFDQACFSVSRAITIRCTSEVPS